ncbi:hypothetical protein QZH41_019197 [Actinostola sp. cb2023]|nr:hypothetical protein QZH41_019197 [Actinostola sp. cb2023]
MYPGKTDQFLPKYEASIQRPYGYLFVDLKPNTPEECRLRTNVLPNDPPQTGGQLDAMKTIVYTAWFRYKLPNKSGGWTIVKRTILQSATLPNEKVYNTYDVISAFSQNDQNIVPTGTAMMDILNKMGFHQIHFYCYKKSVGRVVSIMTKNNTAGQQVVRYFTDDAFAKTTFPDACGSFDRLPEDTSILAQNCDRWGKDSKGRVQVNKWGVMGGNRGCRLIAHAIIMKTKPPRGFGCRWIIPKSFCDDSFDSPKPYNAQDTWRISVR